MIVQIPSLIAATASKIHGVKKMILRANDQRLVPEDACAIEARRTREVGRSLRGAFSAHFRKPTGMEADPRPSLIVEYGRGIAQGSADCDRRPNRPTVAADRMKFPVVRVNPKRTIGVQYRGSGNHSASLVFPEQARQAHLELESHDAGGERRVDPASAVGCWAISRGNGVRDACGEEKRQSSRSSEEGAEGSWAPISCEAVASGTCIARPQRSQ